jgi:hypothetical protein
MDIQVMTPHMEKLGAKVISRDDFLEKLPSSSASENAFGARDPIL